MPRKNGSGFELASCPLAANGAATASSSTSALGGKRMAMLPRRRRAVSLATKMHLQKTAGWEARAASAAKDATNVWRAVKLGPREGNAEGWLLDGEYETRCAMSRW